MRWEDLPLLLHWLQQPHVHDWWRGEPTDLAAVEAEYGACVAGDDPTELFIIASDGRPIGMIQRYLFIDEPEWTSVFEDIVDIVDAAGIDYLIGEIDAVGRGLGAAAVATMTAMVWDWRPVTSIVVNVDQANPASWRVLEKSGFTRVWAGEIDSPDPSDDGPQYVYSIARTQ
jgi:aminoglycoside 6'-N-acetyltransferase